MSKEPALQDVLDFAVNISEEEEEEVGEREGYFRVNGYDRVNARIDSLNQERAERVAKRREPKNVIQKALHRIIPYGGILPSGCNLASSALGAGVLGVPYAFNTSGLVMALVYLVVVAVLTVYSFTLLGIAGKRTGLRNYEQITKALMGKGASYFLAFNMWFYSFGAEVAFIISMGDIFGAFTNSSSDTPAYLKTTSGRRLLTSILWLVAMMPLCLPKEINSLRHMSVIAVVCIILFVTCMIIHSARNLAARGVRDDLVYFQTGNQAIQGLPIFTYALICQLNAYEVYEEMYKPSVARFTKSAGVGVFLSFSLYFSSGFFGYMDFGPALTGTILERYNPIEDKMMGVAYACMMLKLCVGYGLHMIPVRDAVYYVLHIDVKTIAWWKNAMICCSLATLSLIAGFFIPSITIVFGLVGGFAGGFIAYIFPALLFMYSGNFNIKSVGYMHYFGTYFLLLVGVVSVVFGSVFSIYGELVK